MFDYLNLKPQAFGLDISDFSLKIIQLGRRGGFMFLASFLEKEIKQGIVVEGEIKDSAALTDILQEAIKEVKEQKLSTKYVAASLPEEKAFLQVIQMPKMKEEELRKAIRFEAENYVPLSMDKAYLDFQIVSPVVNHLDHLDVLIVALPKQTVDPYVSVLKNAGLKPLLLEMETQAISRALVKDGLASKPILLLDLGANNTRLSIFAGRSLRFTSSIPFSSRKLTEAIAASLKIDFQKAEKIKVKDSPTRQKILQPILTELAAAIEKHLEYYHGHPAHEHLPAGAKVIDKIILSGGGANLAGISDFLATSLKLPVEIGNPWINILSSPLKEVPELPYKESLRYTTALGLALRGLKYD